ncbi:fibronectin type III domain-containing protein [Flagellimonas sp. 2504JD4-2]
MLIAFLGKAQIYPVQVTPQLVPPYSFRLSDYQTTTLEKLFVNLLLTDAQDSGRQVRLRMYIQGQGLDIRTTDFVAGAAPIFLDGGVNQRFSNLDLRPYFSLQNLLGISPYRYGQLLPEGRLTLCFEVYDFISGQPLSRRSCTSAYLQLNEPPLLNFPGRGELVNAREPQNIVFNWTPRHINAPAVQYEFTLKELWDTGMDPQAAFLASPPLHQTTTYATTLLYGPADTPLLVGKTYGWQVRAFSDNGFEQTAQFRNNGLSEIYHFEYQSDCPPPGYVISEARDSRTVQISWQDSPEHMAYRVEYRKKGYGEADWFGTWTQDNSAILRNLEGGTVYEFRVGGECSPNTGAAFSEVHELTTPTEEEVAYYNCGIPPEVEITNREPLQNLGANHVFTAGDFPVTVKTVIDHGAGYYSGWGFIVLPYLADTRVRVEFENIKVNTDHQMVEGMVVTSYDAGWSGIMEIDQVFDDLKRLLENWDGTPEQIQELHGYEATLSNGLDQAASSSQDQGVQSELQQIKENLRNKTQALSNEGEDHTPKAVSAMSDAAKTAVEAIIDAERNKNIQGASQGDRITGDGYFDGVINFTIADEKVQERVLDGPELVDISQMRPKDDEGDHTRVIETHLADNKQLIVSTSNRTNIGSDGDIKGVMERMGSVRNEDYLLWLHYDFHKNQVKYKVSFGNGYFPEAIIAQNELVDLMNDALSYDLKDAIGSSIVALSEGLDRLLEEYNGQLPYMDAEVIEGYTAHDVLKTALSFMRSCGEGFAQQEEGIVPRCLWDSETPLAFSMAYYAGFIDGAWEVLELAHGIAEFSAAWHPLNPVFHTQRGLDIRKKTLDTLIMLNRLVTEEGAFQQARQMVVQQMEQYIDDTVSMDAQGRYNQGKLIFEVASAFFGIAEAKILLKTGKLTSKLLQGLARMPSNLANLFRALPGKFKKLRNNTLAYVLSANTSIEIARYTDDGVLVAKNWVDEPEQTVYGLGQLAIKKTEGIATETAEIALVRDKNGTLGLGLVKAEGAKFGKSFINSLNGFSDDIASLASEQGLSIDDFKLLQQKRYDVMTPIEKGKIDAIRSEIPLPDGNTILQKAIPKADIAKYLRDTDPYYQVGGFVTTAKDAKHLSTFDDVYYGMRLDYDGTAFNLSDGSFGVIRYKTPVPSAEVPRITGPKDKFPFTGNGFTSGNNGKLGVPEWKTPYNTPNDGAELWEVASDGTETIRAIFDSGQNRFIAVP